ncbi:PUA-like domain-containing protein [Crepidotus variabilis]|uniref:PUA-like domain-containing protein n=1 Tax=Crepidotus variabilis TaxID=179855 RepID=A0A9P6ESA5_9AGAR|nr:PUA-like domain-containing protein [Crepidotus variabilis]
MMSKRPYIVGEVNGYPVGSTFEDRKALARAGVHRSVRRGIDWGAGEPACSIVLSAGYSVDNDMGKIIGFILARVITSSKPLDSLTNIDLAGGGLDPSTQGHDKQTTDQEWKRGNAGLLRAYKKASPVRLIRSFRCKSDWAPHEGLRYDGLYTVTKADLVKSKAGLEVCVFKLISQPGQGPIPRKTGYGSFTMYESSDMEESEKEDQLEEEEYRTPPTKW